MTLLLHLDVGFYYSQQWWQSKFEEGDLFILNMLKGDKIILVGGLVLLVAAHLLSQIATQSQSQIVPV